MRARAWMLIGLTAGLIVGSACTSKAASDQATATTSTTTSTSTSVPASDDSTTSSAATNESSGAGALASASGQNGKAAFLEQGNAICTVMNGRSDAVSAPLSDENATRQQIADSLSQIAQATRDAVAGLRALPQPVGDEATLILMYADVDQLAVYADQLVAAVLAQDRPAAAALDQPMTGLQEKTNAEFIAYGLTVCGS